jgi:glutathione S-transferase
MTYIIERYGAGRLAVAPSQPNYTDYLFWFHFANGSMMPSIMIEVIISMLAAGNESAVVRSLLARAERAYDLVERRLGSVSYFAGNEFSAADIIMLFPLTTLRHFIKRDMTPYPNIRAYLKRFGARQAFQRAMSKADPGVPPLLE